MSDQTMKLHDGRGIKIDWVVEYIDDRGKRLSERSVDFIASLVDNPPEEYSPKQVNWLRDLYQNYCG